MIEIDNIDIVEKIKGTGRTFTASIKAGDTIFTEIKNLKHAFPFTSNQKISIGETPSSFIEAEIQDCRLSLQGYELEVNLYIDDYTIPLGFFTVEEPGIVDGNGTQKIIAYDRMSQIGKFNYSSEGYNTIGGVAYHVCEICGYSLNWKNLKKWEINDAVLEGVDCRTVLGYVAGFVGCNAIVDASGVVNFVKYETVPREKIYIDINSLDTLDFPPNSASVDYIFCTIDENTSIDAGQGKYGINTVNPIIPLNNENNEHSEYLQEVLSNLKEGTGVNYYPANFKQLNGDPRIEVGDTLLVQHRNILTGEIEEGYVPVMSLVREFDGGLSVSIEAYEPETEFYISTTDQIKLIQNANKNTTKRAEAVAELNEVVSNALGLYKTEIAGAGGDVKTYYHNASTLSYSTYIFTMNAGGFAFTTGKNCWNGGNPIWQNGITKDGNAIFNYLFAEKISANLIEAGVLKSINGNTEFNLNTGVITQKNKTDEYTDTIFIDNGRYFCDRVYKNEDLTLTTDLRQEGLYFTQKKTSTGETIESGFTQYTLRVANPDELWLKKPLDTSYGGTGANNIIDAQKNLGLGDAAILDIWSGSGGPLGTEDVSSGDLYVPTLRALISWDGTTVGTKSKLRYCQKGEFGDLAVKNWADTDNRYFRRYGLNEINIDNTNGCWSVGISEEGHGTVPALFIMVSQESDGHFFSQRAVKCDADTNPNRKVQGVWYRSKHASGNWSQWTGIQLL